MIENSRIPCKMEKIHQAIIVEDEELARNLIKEFLEEIPSIRLIGEYSDGFSGVKAINEHKPDIVFLDIQMPKLTGFEVLEILDFQPKIIFTTAYDQFAIKAFEINAVDYLLKPYSKERFLEAVHKAVQQLTENSKHPIEKISRYIDQSEEALERVVIRKGKKIEIVPVDDIHYIEAQDDYVMIYSVRGRFLKQKTMKYFEERMNPKKFIRIHRSYIVNVSNIDRLELYEKESYRLHLKDKSTVPVSKNGLKRLKSGLDF
jgi:two-component system LytT family response regulator